jgi:hypothetical protein
MIRAGHLGVKSGKGFFEYEEAGKERAANEAAGPEEAPAGAAPGRDR